MTKNTESSMSAQANTNMGNTCEGEGHSGCGGERGTVGVVGRGAQWEWWGEGHSGSGGDRGTVGVVGRGAQWEWWGEGHSGSGGERGTVGVWLGKQPQCRCASASRVCHRPTSQLLMRLWYSTDVMMDSDPIMLWELRETATHHRRAQP